MVTKIILNRFLNYRIGADNKSIKEDYFSVIRKFVLDSKTNVVCSFELVINRCNHIYLYFNLK